MSDPALQTIALGQARILVRDISIKHEDMKDRARAILAEPTPVRSSEAAVHAARQAAASEILGDAL